MELVGLVRVIVVEKQLLVRCNIALSVQTDVSFSPGKYIANLDVRLHVHVGRT